MKNIDLSKILVGLFLIFLGLGFFLDRIFNISFGQILSYAFPIFIILIGVSIIIRSYKQWFWGLFWIVVGSFILIDRFVDFPFSIWDLWPLIFVFIGLRIIFGNDNSRRSPTATVDSGDNFESVAIFWG